MDKFNDAMFDRVGSRSSAVSGKITKREAGRKKREWEQDMGEERERSELVDRLLNGMVSKTIAQGRWWAGGCCTGSLATWKLGGSFLAEVVTGRTSRRLCCSMANPIRTVLTPPLAWF